MPNEKMTSRQRFCKTMRYGTPDRVPYFEEGIRKDVTKAWQKQGLRRGTDLARMFPSDYRERISPDLQPRPDFAAWPTTLKDLPEFQKRLNADDKKRLPSKWSRLVKAWNSRDHVLMLYVHGGFFKTMGVRGWNRFSEVMTLLMERPDFVRETMQIQGLFSAKLAERILQEVDIDAVVFAEPIGGNDRPLISPGMYENFVLTSYEPLFDVLSRYNVETVIFQTYANARILIPSILRWGFNCLWACEVNTEAMDYRDLRREFGRDLRLIGGIDLDALRRGKTTIQREIEEKVPPLVADGGYVPLADGRVRADVPFENYVYYRQLLQKITGP